jgi:hypothetical protein
MGSDSKAQWETNITGFIPGVWLNEMNHLTTQIVEKVMRAAQASLDVSTCTVELCGHSRGGAIAGHCAVELAKYVNVQHVITFGSAGMSNLVDTGHVEHLFHHVIDKNDPVPTMFGALGQYPGRAHRFTNFGFPCFDAHNLANYNRFVSTTMQKGKKTSVRKNSGTAQTCQRCGKVRTCPYRPHFHMSKTTICHYEI